MAISDMNTLKSIIKNMRDKGMTFQEISDKLDKDYGIKRSRQAVHGLYTRAVDANIAALSEEEMQLTCQIVNTYCLGYNMAQTVNILNGRGIDISYAKVNRTINSNKAYADSVTETMLAGLYEHLRYETNPTLLKARLSFEGLCITEKKFCYLIEELTRRKIKQYAVKQIATAYKLTGERELVKRICGSLPDITVGDIEIELRP